MAFTVLNLPVLPSYSPNQNKNIAAEIPREPRYGDDGAVLHNFRQKHQPHRPLVKAIGDDKETMERCAVWGVNWLSPAPGPLPEANKQSYLRQKDRKKQKPEAKMKANARVKTKARTKAIVKAEVEVKVEAKAVLLKRARERKKRPRPRLSTAGMEPVLQSIANTATCGAAAIFSAHAPSTTQWTRPSDSRAPLLSLPWVVAPWQVSGWVAMDRHRPRAPPPTISTFYPSHHLPPVSRSASGKHRMRVAYSGVAQATALGPSLGSNTPGGPSQRATAGNLYVLQAYPDRVAQEGRVALATSVHSPKLPACFAPRPYRPTPSLTDRLEQYTLSVPYAHGDPASQGQDVISPVASFDHNVYTNMRPTTTSYSDSGPSMNSSPSPLSACAETPRWCATSLLHHTMSQPNAGPMTTHSSMGTTRNVCTTCQDFIPADRRLSGSPSSSVVPALTPKLVEDYLKMAQMTGGCVPQAGSPPSINDRFNMIAGYRAEAQNRPEQVVQPPQGWHSLVWPASPTIAQPIGHGRSDEIMKEDNTYTCTQDVPVQRQPISLPSTCDVKEYPSNQSSYSELLGALQEPAPAPRDQCARPRLDLAPMAKGLWPNPPAVNMHLVGSVVPLLPYAQGPVINQSQSGTSTHLWSQSAHAPLLRPYDDDLHISTIPASSMMANQTSSTHIDSRRFEMRYGHRVPA